MDYWTRRTLEADKELDLRTQRESDAWARVRRGEQDERSVYSGMPVGTTVPLERPAYRRQLNFD